MRTVLVRPLVLLVLAALVAACGGAGGSIAATVNGERVERELLERMVRAQLDAQGVALETLGPEERRDRVEPVQQQVLTALIQFEILEQLAQEFDVELEEEELDAAFDEQVAQFGGEDAYLEETGLTEREFRQLVVATQVRVDALVSSLAEDVGEEELREAYETQRESRFEKRSVRHILVETEEEARDVIERLEDGEDFGELAAEVSQDPGSADNGGEYEAQPRGQYVEAFDQAVWEAEIGELVGPVETDFGFHVLEVTGEEVEEFEEVRDTLEEEVTGGGAQETFNDLVEGAFADADVDVDSAYGRWNASSGAVEAVEPLTPEAPSGEGQQSPGEQQSPEEFERQGEQQGGAGQP